MNGIAGKCGDRVGFPRYLEILLASLGLILVFPVLAMAAILIKGSSPGPIFFRQLRVGQYGREFLMLKFRTMWVNQASVQFTANDDQRITPVGRWLRLFKIDELPELINVLKGDLSLVGPRPEVPTYVKKDDDLWKEVLKAKPGITDPVTLRLRNETNLLASVLGNRVEFYTDVLLPYKLHGYIDFLRHRTLRTDFVVLFRSAFAALWPLASRPPGIEEIQRLSDRKTARAACEGLNQAQRTHGEAEFNAGAKRGEP